MVLDIGTVIMQWQNAGIYDFLLPFLLVFSIVFGILSTTNILGTNKGIHVILAIIIGLMAIGFNYSSGMTLSQFLQVAFPKMAIGISVLLILLISVGLFVPDDEKRYWLWGLGAIGAVIAIIVISQTFSTVGYSMSSYDNYAGWIIGAVLVLGLIIAVASSGGSKSGDKKKFEPVVLGPWYK